jgi:hypothetical protein
MKKTKKVKSLLPHCGRISFFLCQNGHTEPWLGEPDNNSLPWRPCKTCKARMELVRRKIARDTDGRFYLDRVERKVREPKVPIVPKPKNAKMMLRQFSSNLTGYIVKSISNTSIRITRVNDRYRDSGGRFVCRYALVHADDPEQTLVAYLYGVCGWIEDFREAARKAKLPLAFKFQKGKG